MSLRNIILALATVFLCATTIHGATLAVCPSGCTYSTPSAAYNAAAAGDTITIAVGTYTDCIYITKDNLTFMGIGGMPKMTGKICGGKGILVTAGKNLVIKNLELYGVSCSENCAGIRHDAAGSGLTVDNLYIHDNDNGILASSTGDVITITNSRFNNNGYNAGSGQAHNMYFAHAARVIFKNSTSTAAKLGGHDFKSRAARNEIIDSTIAGLGGSDSRCIDISNGGQLYIINSVIEKGPNAQNTEMIGFGPEGVDSTMVQSVTITNSKFIGDRSTTPTIIGYYSTSPTKSITGNTLVAVVASSMPTDGQTYYATRSAAGYQAYPWLPAVVGVTPALPYTPPTSSSTAVASSSTAPSSTAPPSSTAAPTPGALVVCPSGCAYTTPSAAYNAAQAGALIQIQPGTYTDCIYITKANITFEGINGMPAMTGKICGGKGILVTAAPNLTIKNLELYGVSCSENCAGIRHDAVGFNLNLDNMYIHDNDNGLLSSSKDDTIIITNSRFNNNGFNAGSGQAHNMYFAHSARVVFKNSISTAAKLGGHDFKSRAARNEIIDSVIAGLGGSDSRCIDISNGGQLLIQNSVIEKGPNAQNTEMIGFGPEGVDSTMVQSVTITNSKFIGDRSTTPTIIGYYSTTPTKTVTGNTLVAVVASSFPTDGNTYYATRAAAGYQAYPWLPTIVPSTTSSSSTAAASSSTAASTGKSSTAVASSTATVSSTGKSSSTAVSSTATPSSTASTPSSTGATASSTSQPTTQPTSQPTSQPLPSTVTVSSTGTNPSSTGVTGSNPGTDPTTSTGSSAASAVQMTVRMNTDFDTANSDAFKANFTSALASSLGIDASRITVTSVRAVSTDSGKRASSARRLFQTSTSSSVDVDFMIRPSSDTSAPTPSAASDNFNAQLSQPGSALRQTSVGEMISRDTPPQTVTVEQCANGEYTNPCPTPGSGDDGINSAQQTGASVASFVTLLLVMVAL